MPPEQRILLALALVPALLIVRRLTIRLPSRFPLRLPLLALLALALQAALVGAWPQLQGLIWLDTVVQLLVAYGLIRLAVWLLVLPAALGGWRLPPRILRDLLGLVLAAVVTVVLLRERAGVNLVGLVTTSAVLTAVIGLAAQATLKDLLAGISLQLGQPFREGDWLRLDHGTGVVESVTLMNTVLRHADGAQILIPNALMGQSSLQRLTPAEPMGNRLQIGLDYSLPPAQAMGLLHQVLEHHPLVLHDPPPQVWLESYGPSSINYQLLVWQEQTGDTCRMELRSELLSQIWYALERVGQAIPFPVQEWRPHASGTGAGGAPWPAPLHSAEAPATAQAHLVPAAERSRLLAANPLFAQLEPPLRTQLAALCRSLRYGPGETVLREGTDGDSLYQVVSGGLEVLRHTGPGEAQPVARLGPGDVVGEMALLTGAARSATVRTSQETVLLEVHRRDLLPLIEADPTLLDQLAHLISQRQAVLEKISAAAAAGRERSLSQRMRQLFGALASGDLR